MKQHAHRRERSGRSGRRYKKVAIGIWGDQRFRRLSPIPPCGQGLWLFLLTCPASTAIPGLIRGGQAGLAEELGWTQEAFAQAFAEALSEGLVQVDWNARLVWLPNAISYNEPESPNVVKSWRIWWEELPECPLKAIAWQSLKAYCEGMGEAFAQAFREAMSKDMSKSVAVAVVDISTPSNTTRTLPNDGSLFSNPGPAPKVADPGKARRSPRKPAGLTPEARAAFDRLWAAYPKHVARVDAEREFATVPQAEWDAVVAGAERYAAQQVGVEPRFIQAPDRWLKGKRWTDEVPPSKPAPAAPGDPARGRFVDRRAEWANR